MDDGKKVVLRPMPAEATGALRSKSKKHSSLTLLTLFTVSSFDDDVGKDIICGDIIDSSLDVSLPPVWDLYKDEGTENALAKEPCPSCKDGQQLGLVIKPSTLAINSVKFLAHKMCVLKEFQVPKAAGGEQFFFGSLSSHDSMARGALSMLVHGGRWGGRHKNTWKSKERVKLQPSYRGGSSSLVGYVNSFALLFIFDHGESKHLELRSIPFKGGGDDAVVDDQTSTGMGGGKTGLLR